MHRLLILSALLSFLLPAQAQIPTSCDISTASCAAAACRLPIHNCLSRVDNTELLNMAAEAAAAHHSLRSEITRIENNIRTASRLLEQHNNVLQRLERNKEELEHIRQTAPGQIHRQLASDNNALIEKEKKEIDKIDNILRRLYQEKKQLQTEYERQPSETPPVA